MTFLVGGVLILAVAAARGLLHLVRPSPASLALGIYGPFGDTALYFAALKLAPPAEANLIHYLWPLLIVLFAALLPGGRFRLSHLMGAGLGLAATARISTPPTRKVIATLWKGGTAPVIAVNTASVDHSRMAAKPVRVALREVINVLLALKSEIEIEMGGAAAPPLALLEGAYAS
jgi:drug/metabolite transporter (DMT)-like permease